MRRRLTELDFPERMRPRLPVLASQILFALVCSAAAIALRLLLDLWLPNAGPFVVVIPAVLVATLFGRWAAGLITLVITTTYGWYYQLPLQDSFALATRDDAIRLFLALAVGFSVIALAEAFRRAVRDALADRETLLRELDHRVKNNFASIAGLLEMQIRRTDNAETKAALQAALGRIESFSRAHRFLYQDVSEIGTVNMHNYLADLCEVLGSAIGLEEGIRIRCDADPILLPRDRAIAIGLLVNEVATNSAKHAFAGRRDGVIHITLVAERGGYRLDVRDDGCGMPETRRSGSLGLALINSLARQAEADVKIETGTEGTTFHFALAA